MTVSSETSLSADTVEQALAIGLPTCTYPNPVLAEFDTMFPTIVYSTLPSRGVVGDALASADGQCEAAIVPKITYDMWRTSTSNCNLRVTQSIMRARSGSWATSRHSPCVHLAVDWALRALATRGEIERIFQKWLPELPCDGLATKDAAAGSAANVVSRRQLTESTQRTQPPFQRRPGRLLKAGVAGDGSEAGVTATDKVQQMGLHDFAGVFFVWIVTTIVLVVWVEVELHGPKLTWLKKTQKKRIEKRKMEKRIAKIHERRVAATDEERRARP